MNRNFGKIAKFLGLGVAALLLAFLFPQLRQLWQVAYMAMGATWRLIIDILTVSLITFIFAGLLVPFEALGWWAGWYGEEVNTNLHPGELVGDLPTDTSASGYVIYLDGIAQAKFEYLADATNLVEELEKVLPDDILIIKGLMPYSPINRPLTEDGIFSFFWRFVNHIQVSKAGGVIGFLMSLIIQLRNVIVVAISADLRYGPIYNQGTAQVMYNSLINHGYQPDSGVPITLVGYSGGTQIALAAAPYLKRALKAPIDVISISGVFSGNNNILTLEHFYHFVGDKDLLERLGAIIFFQRWKIAFLSYWNRAKKYGKVTITSLGPVGHNDAGGPLDKHTELPDGRSYFQQTVDYVAEIILGNSSLIKETFTSKISNYELYQEAEFNQPSNYPINQQVNPENYRPIANWMGRLILPTSQQRKQVKGALFEVYYAEADYQNLVGKIVNLRWSKNPIVQGYVRSVKKDVHFSEDTKYSQRQGVIHPDRLNGWRMVDPLESLAGSRPNNDVIVKLCEPVEVQFPEGENRPTLVISQEPIQITGRFYGLVRIVQPVTNYGETKDYFLVVHFNRQSNQFDGTQEVVRIPQVIADINKTFPSTNQNLHKSSLNSTGWYIYGALDDSGVFIVQAIAPLALLRLQPHQVIYGESDSWDYIKNKAWEIKGKKGKIQSVLLIPQSPIASDKPLVSNPQWQEGDRALVLHLYGGIGGKKREPAAKTPIFFGHFAYGIAQVIKEPLANELIFDIVYYQVYTHNVDGIIAGKIAWNRFVGDRQFGWLGNRPITDMIIKFDPVTTDFDIKGTKVSALDLLAYQLEVMVARYRIGDGTGGTYVGPAYNCVQDSNQALYGTIKMTREAIDSHPQLLEWLQDDPGEPEQLEQLLKLGKSLKEKLLPLGSARADWENNHSNLGISPEEDLFDRLLTGLLSWRTLLPRLSSETLTRIFLKQGASIWVLRANQIGAEPNIEPIAPTHIGW
jgi:predicted Abi (CAAX) family protease